MGRAFGEKIESKLADDEKRLKKEMVANAHSSAKVPSSFSREKVNEHKIEELREKWDEDKVMEIAKGFGLEDVEMSIANEDIEDTVENLREFADTIEGTDPKLFKVIDMRMKQKLNEEIV